MATISARVHLTGIDETNAVQNGARAGTTGETIPASPLDDGQDAVMARATATSPLTSVNLTNHAREDDEDYDVDTDDDLDDDGDLDDDDDLDDDLDDDDDLDSDLDGAANDDN